MIPHLGCHQDQCKRHIYDFAINVCTNNIVRIRETPWHISLNIAWPGCHCLLSGVDCSLSAHQHTATGCWPRLAAFAVVVVVAVGLQRHSSLVVMMMAAAAAVATVMIEALWRLGQQLGNGGGGASYGGVCVWFCCTASAPNSGLSGCCSAKLTKKQSTTSNICAKDL